MVLGDLIGTPERGTPPTDAERTLTVTARGAAAVGVWFVVLGGLSLMLTLLRHGLTVDAVLGGGGLAIGGGLWVVAQGFVARWISDRRPRTLLLAVLCGTVAVLAFWVGWGTVVNFSWIPVGAAAVVALAEWMLIRTVDPAWSSRGHGADAVESLSETDEALVLGWLAQGALSLGVGAGVVVTFQLIYHVLNWGDFNFLGAFALVYLYAAVGAWCAPQLALLTWAGRRVRPTAPVILIGLVVWAALIWAVSGDEELWLAIPLLAGAVLVLEVALVCMILWRRLGDPS